MRWTNLCVKLFLSFVSNLKGLCGLHYAADFDEAVIFSELLACDKVDLMKKTAKGLSVFALVAGSNCVRVLKLLLASERLDKQAGLVSRNDWDETPLHIGTLLNFVALYSSLAVAAGNYEIIQVCYFYKCHPILRSVACGTWRPNRSP